MTMLLSIIIFLLSIVPSVLIFILLRNRQKENDLYRKKCTYSFITGVISVLPILLLSGILFILNAVLKIAVMKDVNVLVYKALYKFIVTVILLLCTSSIGGKPYQRISNSLKYLRLSASL